jgi:hypothetical protein
MKVVTYTLTVEIYKTLEVEDDFDVDNVPDSIYPRIMIKDPSYTISEVIGEKWEESK